jgi:glycosyltransferase involved in cell wall biosynthesis
MFCSIIIPLYNKERFINAALQSVLKQRHQNFEIIVVDDGSTDGGPSRVKAIQDRRIHLIQQTNAGVSCARNRGIEQAKGDLVCFLDADDWYLPDYLENIVSMANQYPDIPFFATSFKKSTSPQSDVEMFWQNEFNSQYELVDNFFDRWWRCPFFCACSIAIRREHLASFQPCFPPGEQLGEDQDLYFRLVEKSSMVYCPIPLVGYRIDVEGSLCTTSDMQLLPVYKRLELRALHRQIPEKHRSAALRLVTEAKVTLARNLIIVGRRHDAWLELPSVRRGVISRRWWVTLLFCAIITPALVRKWEHWRDPEKRPI